MYFTLAIVAHHICNDQVLGVIIIDNIYEVNLCCC